MGDYAGQTLDLGAALRFFGIGPQAKQDKELLKTQQLGNAQQEEVNKKLLMENQALKGYFDHVNSITDPLERLNRLTPEYFQKYSAGMANQAGAKQADFAVKRGEALLPGEQTQQGAQFMQTQAETGARMALTKQAESETSRNKAEQDYLEKNFQGAPTVNSGGLSSLIGLQKAQTGNIDSEKATREADLGLRAAGMFGEQERMNPNSDPNDFLSVLASLPGATGQMFKNVQQVHASAAAMKKRVTAQALFKQLGAEKARTVAPQFEEFYREFQNEVPASTGSSAGRTMYPGGRAPKNQSGESFMERLFNNQSTVTRHEPETSPSYRARQAASPQLPPERPAPSQPSFQSFMPQMEPTQSRDEMLRQILQLPGGADKARAADQDSEAQLRRVIQELQRRVR
jgi:hypothetical protein